MLSKRIELGFCLLFTFLGAALLIIGIHSPETMEPMDWVFVGVNAAFALWAFDNYRKAG